MTSSKCIGFDMDSDDDGPTDVVDGQHSTRGGDRLDAADDFVKLATQLRTMGAVEVTAGDYHVKFGPMPIMVPAPERSIFAADDAIAAKKPPTDDERIAAEEAEYCP